MADKAWTIKTCLDWTRGYLERRGDERPRYTAELLLTSVTGLTRVDIYTNYDKPLAKEELDRMHDAVVRRAKGEPVQYIVGSTGFRMLDIICEPGVLIPRPETEVLVSEVLDFLDHEVLGLEGPGGQPRREKRELPWNSELEAAIRAESEAAAVAGRGEGQLEDADQLEDEGGHSPADADADADVAASAPTAEEPEPASEAPCAPSARVLEVGCGTGCISLSIVSERPGKVTCVATDISPQAVRLAARNRDALEVDPLVFSIREGDLVSPVTDEELQTFDVLVSNPPYIPHDVMAELPREVADYEPELALEGGEDGLDIFRRLVDAAPRMLRPGGLLACELYEGSLEDAAAICTEAGMRDVRIVQDLTHRPRIILARV